MQILERSQLKQRVHQLASQWHPEVIRYRRHLHQYPELSFHEVETASYIKSVLEEMGLEIQTGVGGHGIVCLVTGDKGCDRVVALRADIDALPIQEHNDVSYRSHNDGVMHACGHDVHTSSLLGAIKILHDMRAHFGGVVKCLFQPAEERLPGGASLMIRDGALKDPIPETIVGQHVHPPLEVGKIGVKSGMYMASADELYITVKGKGGHGALPQDVVDPVLISAHLIVALQQVVSRRSNPTIPTVLSIGKINSTGGATNVIPSEVKLVGTFRTMDEAWRAEAHKNIEDICYSMATALGGSCEVNIKKGYPFLMNDPELTDQFARHAKEYLGSENVVDLPIRMTAEDFAYYSQHMPACFYRLGTGNQGKGITSAIHTPTFDVDEDCLRIGMGVLAYSSLAQLLEF